VEYFVAGHPLLEFSQVEMVSFVVGGPFVRSLIEESSMGINKAIEAVAIFTVLVVSTGQVPRLVHQAQVAQLRLLKASQSSSWGHALILPPSK